MKERTGIHTVGGNPVTLLGDEPKVGEKAPDFTALDNDLKPVKLSDYLGKTVVISVVSSLDTSVCDVQTRRFNKEVDRMAEGIVILTISMDLPFAQKRWCQANSVKSLTTLSDHKDADFGLKYGLVIKEMRLLARSILVIDKDGILRYFKTESEMAQEPDYEAALDSLAEFV